MRLSGLLNLRRSGQAKRVTVPGAAQLVTHSTCLNDQLEVKVQRIVTARPMSLMVGWDRGADRASNDADVSSILPIIPYGGLSQVRLDGWLSRQCLRRSSAA